MSDFLIDITTNLKPKVEKVENIVTKDNTSESPSQPVLKNNVTKEQKIDSTNEEEISFAKSKFFAEWRKIWELRISWKETLNYYIKSWNKTNSETFLVSAARLFADLINFEKTSVTTVSYSNIFARLKNYINLWENQRTLASMVRKEKFKSTYNARLILIKQKLSEINPQQVSSDSYSISTLGRIWLLKLLTPNIEIFKVDSLNRLYKVLIYSKDNWYKKDFLIKYSDFEKLYHSLLPIYSTIISIKTQLISNWYDFANRQSKLNSDLTLFETIKSDYELLQDFYKKLAVSNPSSSEIVSETPVVSNDKSITSIVENTSEIPVISDEKLEAPKVDDKSKTPIVERKLDVTKPVKTPKSSDSNDFKVEVNGLFRYFTRTLFDLDKILYKLFDKQSVTDDLTSIMSSYIKLKKSKKLSKLSWEFAIIFDRYCKEFISFYNDFKIDFIPKFLSWEFDEQILRNVVNEFKQDVEEIKSQILSTVKSNSNQNSVDELLDDDLDKESSENKSEQVVAVEEIVEPETTPTEPLILIATETTTEIEVKLPEEELLNLPKEKLAPTSRKRWRPRIKKESEELVSDEPWIKFVHRSQLLEHNSIFPSFHLSLFNKKSLKGSLINKIYSKWWERDVYSFGLDYLSYPDYANSVISYWKFSWLKSCPMLYQLLSAELNILNRRYQRDWKIAYVYLHDFWDFPSIEYVNYIQRKLDELPNISFLGITHRNSDTDEIWKAVADLKQKYPNRFEIDFLPSSGISSSNDVILWLTEKPSVKKSEFSILKYSKTDRFIKQFPNYKFIDSIFEIKTQWNLSLDLVDLNYFKQQLLARFTKKIDTPVWYFEWDFDKYLPYFRAFIDLFPTAVILLSSQTELYWLESKYAKRVITGKNL